MLQKPVVNHHRLHRVKCFPHRFSHLPPLIKYVFFNCNIHTGLYNDLLPFRIVHVIIDSPLCQLKLLLYSETVNNLSLFVALAGERKQKADLHQNGYPFDARKVLSGGFLQGASRPRRSRGSNLAANPSKRPFAAGKERQMADITAEGPGSSRSCHG